MARAHAKRAIERLAGIMDASNDENAVVRAAITLLDRGYGKSEQTVEAKHDGEIKITVRQITEGKK
jgi:hypothetical protein